MIGHAHESPRPVQHDPLIRAAAVVGAEVDYLVTTLAEVMGPPPAPFANVVAFTDGDLRRHSSQVSRELARYLGRHSA